MDSTFAEGDSSAYIPQDLLSTLTKDRKYTSRRPKTSSQTSFTGPRSPEQARKLKDESATVLSSLNRRGVLGEQPSYTPNKRLHSSASGTSDEGQGTAKPASRVGNPRVSSTSSSRSSSALSARSDLMLVNETSPEEVAQLKARLAKVEGEKAAVERQLQAKANGVGEVQLEALKEQFSTQERLLGAYQRENEKSLTELSALRNRERAMATHLLKLHGPNWEAQVFDSSPSTGSSRTTSTSPVIRSNSRNPFSTSPSIEQTISPSTSASNESQTQGQAQDNARLLAHIASVQLLVQGMERRLIEAEEDMSRREKEARREGERARALMQQAK